MLADIFDKSCALDATDHTYTCHFFALSRRYQSLTHSYSLLKLAIVIEDLLAEDISVPFELLQQEQAPPMIKTHQLSDVLQLRVQLLLYFV
jgi:hypothetical protein